MSARTGYIVHGTREMIGVGTAALDALGAFAETVGDADGCTADVAEIRIYENAPITALIMTDYSTTLYAWNGETWVVEEVR